MTKRIGFKRQSRASSGRNDHRKTVALPGDLLFALDKRVVEEGYGLRGRSKWLREALQQLVHYEDYVQLIGMPQGVKSARNVTFTLDDESMQALNKAVADVRASNVFAEGVSSEVIRTAIYQRLLRTSTETSKRKSPL